MASIESLDLESGGNTSQQDAGLELLWSKRPKSKFLSSDLDVFLSSSESIMCKCRNQSSGSLDEYSQVRIEIREVKVEMCSENSQGRLKLGEKVHESERLKNSKSRNAQKPPRPPKGPSLDAADQKLVREIMDLARRKRARIEQIKAAKKLKATKAPSVQSGISAMIFTLLFLCVIIFQGISSTTAPNVNTQRSPEPAVATAGDLTLLQYPQRSMLRSSFENSVEDQASRSGPAEKEKKRGNAKVENNKVVTAHLQPSKTVVRNS